MITSRGVKAARQRDPQRRSVKEVQAAPGFAP
jgi:hypothetical protein